MNKLAEYKKALAAFIGPLALFAGALLASPALVALFPSTVIAILTIVAASGVLAGVVAIAPTNKITPDQIIKQGGDLVTQVGVAVASTAVTAGADAVSNAVQDYLHGQAATATTPVANQVLQVAEAVPSVVNAAIQDFIAKNVAK